MRVVGVSFATGGRTSEEATEEMAQFVEGQPIDTSEPFIQVDAGLPPGLHRFRLEVFNAAGRASQPVDVVVRVLPRRPGPLGPPGGGILRDGFET